MCRTGPEKTGSHLLQFSWPGQGQVSGLLAWRRADNDHLQKGVEVFTKPWLSPRNYCCRICCATVPERRKHGCPQEVTSVDLALKRLTLSFVYQNAFSSLAWRNCVWWSQVRLNFVWLCTSKTTLVTTKCFVLVVSLSKPTRKSKNYLTGCKPFYVMITISHLDIHCK